MALFLAAVFLAENKVRAGFDLFHLEISVGGDFSDSEKGQSWR